MMMMEEKKMKPKWRFIFQINEHGSGTQLHEEKGQNKDLTALTTHPNSSSSYPFTFLPVSSYSFSLGFLLWPTPHWMPTCDLLVNFHMIFLLFKLGLGRVWKIKEPKQWRTVRRLKTIYIILFACMAILPASKFWFANNLFKWMQMTYN